MIFGKIKGVTIAESYGENGEYLGKKAKYNIEPLLTWIDIIIGLSVALLIATQIFN